MNNIKLWILGCLGPFDADGRGTTGYAVEYNGKRLMVDCGSGCLAEFRRIFGKTAMPDAIILTHLHDDHCCELPLVAYALDLENGRGTAVHEPIPLYLPSEPADACARMSAPKAFIPCTDESEAVIAGIRVSFIKGVHPVPCRNLRLDCGGRSIVLLGDTMYHEGLDAFCEGVELISAHVGRLTGEKGPHITPAEAAALANGRSKRLLLSHFYAFTPPELCAAEAKTVLKPEVELITADKGMCIEL